MSQSVRQSGRIQKGSRAEALTKPMVWFTLGLLILLACYALCPALPWSRGAAFGSSSLLAKALVGLLVTLTIVVLAFAEAKRKRKIQTTGNAGSSSPITLVAVTKEVSAKILGLVACEVLLLLLALHALSPILAGSTTEVKAVLLDIHDARSVRPVCARKASVWLEASRVTARFCLETQFGTSANLEGIRIGDSIWLRVRDTPFYAVAESGRSRSESE